MLALTNLHNLNSLVNAEIFVNFYLKCMIYDFPVGGSPTIKKHPDDKNGAVGKSVTFECQATGAVPLIYSWMHDGVDMPARKKSTLVVTVKKDSRGQYSCRVQNDFGSTTSNAATLTVGKCISN